MYPRDELTDINTEIENSIEWDAALAQSKQIIRKTFYFDAVEYYKPSSDFRLDGQLRDKLAQRGIQIAANQFKYFSYAQKHEMLNNLVVGQSFRICFSLPKFAREAAKRGDYKDVKIS